jgi:hypothetical protein
MLRKLPAHASYDLVDTAASQHGLEQSGEESRTTKPYSAYIEPRAPRATVQRLQCQG